MSLQNLIELPVGKQQLLFQRNDPLLEQGLDSVEVPAQFYEAGQVLFENIPSYDQALAKLGGLINSLDPEKLPLVERFRPRLKFAKIDKIPVCRELVQTDYQALHFDMGQPFYSEEEQDLYLFVALYMPMTSPKCQAKTRLLSLKQLGQSRSWPKDLRKNIENYVKNHGDGWEKTKSYDFKNTWRLSCFGRLVDGMFNGEELAAYTEMTTADWFQDGSDATYGFVGLERELQFFKQHGIDTLPLENHYCLNPGELLIFDNVNAVHGRVGKREESEIYQFMLGVPRASVSDINFLREQIFDHFLGEDECSFSTKDPLLIK